MPFLSLGMGTAYSYAVTAPVPENPAPPKWIAPWLALLAPLYIISPLSLLALPYLKKLPKPALYVLGFYALSQQIPALFTPEPLLASVLALVRTLLMFGLIGVGVALGDSQRLKPFVIGLVIVFVTALIYSFSAGLDIFINRLSHPYMTSTTLGLAGAFGIWLSMFNLSKYISRIPLFILSVGILVFSGSRGSLIAAIIGSLMSLVFLNRRIFTIALATIFFMLALINVGGLIGISSIGRLSTISSADRFIIWNNTLSIIKSFPIGGIGNYQLGKYLEPQENSCPDRELRLAPEIRCSHIVQSIGSPWIIAHNFTLQSFAESGILGFSGILFLLSTIVMCIIKRKDLLSIAIFTGIVFSSINDNTTLVPSPFFGEMFWIISGMALRDCANPIRKFYFTVPLLAGVLTSSLALLALSTNAAFRGKDSPQFTYLNLGSQISDTNKSYFVISGLSSGLYKGILTACSKVCHTLDRSEFQVSQNTSSLIELSTAKILPEDSIITLYIFSNHTLPIANYSWGVGNK